MIRKCGVCGRDFAAKRSTAKYCSATCRSRAHRGYPCAASSRPAAPVPGASMSVDEVAAVVGRAHGAAADLSRAALLTPSPLCLSLSAAAAKVEDALKSEGL